MTFKVRHHFPDLDGLKSMIARRRAEGEGWNTVILNVKTRSAERPDVDVPLSLFMNLSGASYCGIGSHNVRVTERTYFLSNAMQPYSLRIQEPAETFNIHFGEQFTRDVLFSLYAKDEQAIHLPAQTQSGQVVHFFERLYDYDERLMQLILSLHHAQATDNDNALLIDDYLYQILSHLVRVHQHDLKTLNQLSAVKHSTRLEIYKHLLRARDYMTGSFSETLTLDEIAGIACMSKFHFLRWFKQAFGLTPHQYITRRRIDHAKTLLAQTSLPVSDIVLLVGFESLGTFSSLFRRMNGVSPLAYRACFTGKFGNSKIRNFEEMETMATTYF